MPGQRWVAPTSNRFRFAVIDPEDAEQVKRLDDLLTRFLDGNEVPAYEGTEGVMKAALREYANPKPPKPDEPTGLGAVVEDNEGTLWVRTEPADGDVPAWVASWTGRLDEPQPSDYADLLVNRVLSEGVDA
jgi:hypothetical protein